MTHATSCCCGERTRRALGWISIIWFLSALSFAGGQIVQLQTAAEVLASCGDNVTLTCNATSLRRADISLFAWVDGEKSLCEPGGGLCERSAGTTHHTLSLTLRDVMPVDGGKYTCKLRSALGAESKSTVLTVQNCLESSDASMNESHATCRFHGVYPNRAVHWFQGDDDLTGGAVTEEVEDEGGRYNIQSTLAVATGSADRSVNCSLWARDEHKYVSTQQLFGSHTEKVNSPGSAAKLQWISVLAEVLMLNAAV